MYILIQRLTIHRFRCLVSKEAKIISTTKGRLFHKPNGLTTVHRLNQCNLLSARSNVVCELIQQLFPRLFAMAAAAFEPSALRSSKTPPTRSRYASYHAFSSKCGVNIFRQVL